MDQYEADQKQWSESVDATDAHMCDRLPDYNGWHATYEYPGFIHYSRPGQDIVVVATSDWEYPDTLDVQIQTNDGWCSPAPYGGYSGGGVLTWPREGRTPERLFDLLKPFLDEYEGVNHVHACTRCGARLRL